MGWSKLDLINQAFEEVGIAPYVFDLSTEQLKSALRKLDTMVAAWEAMGIRLGYPLPSSPAESQLSNASGLPDWAVGAVYQNLALQLASLVGKEPSAELKKNARMGYNSVLAKTRNIPEMRLPRNMPAGQGHKPWRQPAWPFLNHEEHPLDAESDSELEINAAGGSEGGSTTP